ncbi:hypothetical protein ATANTOWER_022022 [Ataeniobius toweri]|uniref:Secreted protein n=1 Tax=Ataeniobius toweri TaxID=208326 RepID=A0ABU7AHA6_9TELE|nr:hypothetical protein [Ataeniobius toweri]
MNGPVADVFLLFCSCFSGLLQFVNLTRRYSQQQVRHLSLCPDENISPSFAQGVSECITAHAEGVGSCSASRWFVFVVRTDPVRQRLHPASPLIRLMDYRLCPE